MGLYTSGLSCCCVDELMLHNGYVVLRTTDEQLFNLLFICFLVVCQQW